MICEHVEGMLSAYLDNMLALSDSQQIRRHLRHCSSCQKRLDEMRYLDELIMQLPLIEPESSLKARIFSQLEEKDISIQAYSPHTVRTEKHHRKRPGYLWLLTFLFVFLFTH